MASGETSGNAFVERFEVPPLASGPLDGLTFAAKDLFDVAGRITGCGNPRWRETHAPAVANAVAIDLLLAAGAKLVGKTITEELAFGIIGENAHYGTPLNPRAPDRVPGGSSSGSASAVAQGECDFALGTDTTGSVRIPASSCGLFGMRPSHDRVSLAGVMPFGPSFDTVGVLARDVEVLTLAMTLLLGCDLDRGVESVFVETDLILLREAWALVEPETAATCRRWLDERGIATREVGLAELVGGEGSDPGVWFATHCQIHWAEIQASLGTWIETARPAFGPLAAANFSLLAHVDRPGLPATVRRRETLAARLGAWLASGRILCFPSTSAPPPRKGRVYGDRRTDGYMAPTLTLQTFATVGRLPHVTVPAGAVDGGPVGISFVGAHGADARLLAAVRALLRASRA